MSSSCFDEAGLLKNAHLPCCAANRTAQRIFIRVTFRLYASRFVFLRALHLNIFEQPLNFCVSTIHKSKILISALQRCQFLSACTLISTILALESSFIIFCKSG